MFHTAVQRGFKSRGKYTYFAENSLLFPTVKEFQNRLTVEVIAKVRHHVFTALHGMQTRYSDEKAIRLSMRQTREL